MNSFTKLNHLLDTLVRNNAAFACWFAPSCDIPQIIIGSKEDILFPESINELNSLDGFVFAPYRKSESSPIILLRPGVNLRGYEEIGTFDIRSLPPAGSHENENKKSASTKFDDYMACVNTAIDQIKISNFSKVIVSRRRCTKRKDEPIGRLFLDIHTRNPDAFVFIANLPEAGLWMGASPELLFSTDGKTAKTVSLAGTQPLRPDGEYCWYTKEIEEQAFVSRYTVDVLHKFGFLSYKTRGPEDLETTAVAHLKTSFFFAADKIENRLGDFVAELFPTPAVCGLPKAEADRFIDLYEPHDRRYYTGFLGPWRLNGNSADLHVNLRCMEIEKDQYVLYTGGGITARSCPEKEWEETSQKAKTLLNVIDSLQKKEQ